MALPLGSFTLQATQAEATNAPVAEEEEYYSSWSLFLVCMLLILSLWTSYYLQIRRIRAVHETVVSIFASMFVGLVVRLAAGTMIREMLVSRRGARVVCVPYGCCPGPPDSGQGLRQTVMHRLMRPVDRRSSIRCFSTCFSRRSS